MGNSREWVGLSGGTVKALLGTLFQFIRALSLSAGGRKLCIFGILPCLSCYSSSEGFGCMPTPTCASHVDLWNGQ